MQRDITRMANQKFDILVVGGGVHGAWIALGGAQAGYRVALIEKGDFGSATSANSLKILHGGLRYLQHLDFARMRSSIRARRAFMRLVPHLVRPLPCLMPLEARGVRSPWILGPALLANDAISFDRNSGLTRNARIPMGGLVSGAETARRVRSLSTIDPFAGALWWDALADDVHRLVLEPLLLAAEQGAEVANQVAATTYLRDADRVIGVAAVDQLTGRQFDIHAAVTVNATGPSAGVLSERSGLPRSFLPHWVGALNLVLRRSLGNDVAIALSARSKRTDDSAVLRRTTRELFFAPWQNVTMVGTDYHPVTDGQVQAASHPPAGAVDAFIAEINAVAPNAGITKEDVARVHWGILPCQEVSRDVPRKSPVLAHDAAELGAKGLIVAVGEKLTSAPIVAELTMHAISAKLGPRPIRSPPAAKSRSVEATMEKQAGNRLRARYGQRRWQAVMALANSRPELLLPVLRDSEILAVEVVHAIHDEMASDLASILRRLGADDAGSPAYELIERVAAIAGDELGWSAEEAGSAIRRAHASMEVSTGVSA